MILDLMWEFDFYVLYIAKHIPRDSYSIERSYKKSYVLVLYPIRNINERLKRDIPYLAGASTLKGMRLTNIAKISFVQNQMEENVFTLLKVFFYYKNHFLDCLFRQIQSNNWGFALQQMLPKQAIQKIFK